MYIKSNLAEWEKKYPHEYVSASLKYNEKTSQDLILKYKNWMIISIVSLFAVIFSCLILYVRALRKHNNFMLTLRLKEQQRILMEQYIQKTKAREYLRQQTLLDESMKLNEEKSEPVARLQSQLDQLEAQLAALNSDIKMRENSRTTHRMANNDTIARLHFLCSPQAHGALPTDEDWDNLRKIVEGQYSDSYAITNKNVVLRDEEYIICLLIKSGFSLSEICLLLNISNSKLTNIRMRLLKKNIWRGRWSKRL